MDEANCDVCVVGGGFFGLMIAAHAARQGRKVVLLERGDRLMARASLNNQARVHNGYHYPRSFLTAARSAANYPRFCAEFGDAVISDFRKIYAVARYGSKVSARHFRSIFKSIGVPIDEAPQGIAQLFEPRLIDGIFSCQESVFDANLLRQIAVDRCQNAGVDLRLESEVVQIQQADRGVRARCVRKGDAFAIRASLVFNATYGRIRTTAGHDVPVVRHEITEMCLIEPPGELAGCGLTVMCGPFFSAMPYPALGKAYTLSHVRYTPHATWVDEGSGSPDPYTVLDAYPRRSAFDLMIADARRFAPCFSAARQTGSIWEVKTILPRSDGDDSRPILFHASSLVPGVYSVLGGKMDNFYDALQAVDAILSKI